MIVNKIYISNKKLKQKWQVSRSIEVEKKTDENLLKKQRNRLLIKRSPKIFPIRLQMSFPKMRLIQNQDFSARAKFVVQKYFIWIRLHSFKIRPMWNNKNIITNINLYIEVNQLLKWKNKAFHIHFLPQICKRHHSLEEWW